jgi:uncharacterized damage-inducible protein DinB
MQPSQAVALAEYNRWANARLFRKVVQLAPEQLQATCWLS